MAGEQGVRARQGRGEVGEERREEMEDEIKSALEWVVARGADFADIRVEMNRTAVIAVSYTHLTLPTNREV